MTRSYYDSLDKPGFYKGKHYTEYVEQVKALKREKKLKEVEHLLLALIDAVEAQQRHDGHIVPPWYYKQLAIIYRSRKDYLAEIKILERHESLPHIKKSYMRDRLDKAYILLDFQQRGDIYENSNEYDTDEMNTTE